MSDILERLRALFFRRRWDRDLDDEIRDHLERDAAALERGGMSAAEAARKARLRFGGADRYKEAVRDASGVRPLTDVMSDVRFALRALRRNPGFTAATLTVLALAIGASTAVFSVVNAVLLSELPYPHAGRLVRVFMQNTPGNRWNLSTVDWQAVRDQSQSFEEWGAISRSFVALSGAGEPQRVLAARVTSGFFGALSARAASGRLIEAADEPVGATPVVVVSHALAEQRLGGAEAAVGKAITLDGVSHAVVGVLPRGVEELAGFQATAWSPLRMPAPTRRGPFWMQGVGRLKPGVSVADAAREMAAIAERIYPIWEAGWRDRVAKATPYPLRETVVGRATGQLRLFAGAVALVLLVAIANVATLMLVRATARRPELQMRATLGASRGRLARLVITEGLVLTLAAALLGTFVAALSLRLVTIIAPTLPRSHEIALDWQSVLVALAIAIVAGVLVSLSPVLGVLRGAVRASAPADARRSGGARRGNLVRGVLVGAEFALALPLLLGAGLLLNSFLRLQRVDPGYDPHAAFGVTIALPSQRYPDVGQRQVFWRQALMRVAEVPGVVSAGFATSGPPDDGGNINNFALVDRPVPPGAPEPTSHWSNASGSFFQALGIPLLEGRTFTETDTGNAGVAIVSRSWARRYFPGENVVGRQLVEGGCYDCPLTTIIGVAGDVKYGGLAGDGEGVYTPITQSQTSNAILFVRTSAAPESFIRPVLAALSALDPELPLAGVTMAERTRDALGDPRRWTAVLSAFAAAALLLAALGVFGLMSYVVRQQRREIGVRLALGAEPADVARMVVARGMRYAVPGTLAGLGLALLEARWLGSLLYDVSARDPRTIAAVTLLLLAVATAACLLPGLRASRIRPIEAIASD